MQEKKASNKEDTTALSNGESFLKNHNLQVADLSRHERSKKDIKCCFGFRCRFKPIEGKHAVAMMAKRLRPAVNTTLKVNELVRLKVQLGQRIAEVGFPTVTNLATETILGTPCFDRNTELIS